jgi:hypothetical protein
MTRVADVSIFQTKGLFSSFDHAVIGSYGHCNQELVNLLLTGRATSNVFDGTKLIGDSGITLKGIAQQSEVGYLTHLESLRYCQVIDLFRLS